MRALRSAFSNRRASLLTFAGLMSMTLSSIAFRAALTISRSCRPVSALRRVVETLAPVSAAAVMWQAVFVRVADVVAGVAVQVAWVGDGSAPQVRALWLIAGN